MKDALLIFFCFIIIILFGFSVASWSLLTAKHQVIWPNTTNGSFSNTTLVVEAGAGIWSWQVFRDVLNWGLWKVFGQVAEPYNHGVSGTHKVFLSLLPIKNSFIFIVLENDAYGTFVFIFAIAFTVTSNVLLLNVLIAMFKWVQRNNKFQVFEWFFLVQCSEKYERVQEKSNELWRCQRFWLVYEFKEKTVLPPPLNIPCYIFRLIKTLCHYCEERRKPFRDNQNASKIILTVIFWRWIFFFTLVDTHQMDREKVIAETYWQYIFEEKHQKKT